MCWRSPAGLVPMSEIAANFGISESVLKQPEGRLDVKHSLGRPLEAPCLAAQSATDRSPKVIGAAAD